MNLLKKLFIVLLCIILNYGGYCQEIQGGSNSFLKKEAYPLETIPNTQVRYIYSKSTKCEYKISIRIPSNYSDTAHYPVIYLTDANVSFAFVAQMLNLLEMAGDIKPVILVGIGYKNDSLWAIYRNRDLTPVKDNSMLPIVTGGGPQFLKFIQNELKPIITKEFRQSVSDSYMGFSFGGLFGLYTLFNEPGTFQNYVIGSPSIWYGNQVTYKYFEKFKSNHDDLSARVFMSVGSLEETNVNQDTLHMIDNWKVLSDKLMDLHYKHFHLRSSLIQFENHMSGIFGGSYDWGVHFIYNNASNVGTLTY